MEDNEQSVFTVPIPMIGISIRPTDKEIDEWVASYDWDKHEKDLEDEEKIEEEELLMKTTTKGTNDERNEIRIEEVDKTSTRNRYTRSDVDLFHHSHHNQVKGKLVILTNHLKNDIEFMGEEGNSVLC